MKTRRESGQDLISLNFRCSVGLPWNKYIPLWWSWLVVRLGNQAALLRLVGFLPWPRGTVGLIHSGIRKKHFVTFVKLTYVLLYCPQARANCKKSSDWAGGFTLIMFLELNFKTTLTDHFQIVVYYLQFLHSFYSRSWTKKGFNSLNSTKDVGPIAH